MNIEERLKAIARECGLKQEDMDSLSHGLAIKDAERMVENVIGTHKLPLGIATNFRINGKEYLIPMAIEETSVIAAASNGARYALPKGFKASFDGNITVGQVQLKVKNAKAAKALVLKRKREIIRKMNEIVPEMVRYGGGAKDMGVSTFVTKRGQFAVVYLHFDTANAMGANTINTVCEKLAPWLADLVGGTYILRIISNYAVEKIARASATFDKEVVGEATIEGILDAYALACADVRRAATHNKGIMNGMDSVAIATGNDWRALEAGAHSYAARNGRYQPLTAWSKDGKGNLVGKIELPVQIGIVGGITSIHPTARVSLKILGAKSAGELAGIMAAVGLAQNFAALRALASEGIQKGHMKLHATNFATMAGATGDMIEKIAKRMVEEKNISYDRAQALLKEAKQK